MPTGLTNTFYANDLVASQTMGTDRQDWTLDPAHRFRGCIPGIHEVLRRQGLLEGIWCLDKNETLSPGQSEEIDRVIRSYPHLTDDDFLKQHRDDWLNR